MKEKIREAELRAEALTDEELEAVTGGLETLMTKKPRLYGKLPEEENQDIRYQRIRR